uniref:Uncharacterized protein n=1 Tax=Fusarium oxysporum (strain Fo5176) TaxID=660025 RepID=A0A0D2Y000_FUSOF
MTGSERCASASALLHAMLAYSSLHHHGLSETSLKFKVQALHLLSTSAEDGELSLVNASQHVAASMLLGSFEETDATLSSQNDPATVNIQTRMLSTRTDLELSG